MAVMLPMPSIGSSNPEPVHAPRLLNRDLRPRSNEGEEGASRLDISASGHFDFHRNGIRCIARNSVWSIASNVSACRRQRCVGVYRFICQPKFRGCCDGRDQAQDIAFTQVWRPRRTTTRNHVGLRQAARDMLYSRRIESKGLDCCEHVGKSCQVRCSLFGNVDCYRGRLAACGGSRHVGWKRGSARTPSRAHVTSGPQIVAFKDRRVWGPCERTCPRR